MIVCLVLVVAASAHYFYKSYRGTNQAEQGAALKEDSMGDSDEAVRKQLEELRKRKK